MDILKEAAKITEDIMNGEYVVKFTRKELYQLKDCIRIAIDKIEEFNDLDKDEDLRKAQNLMNKIVNAKVVK